MIMNEEELKIILNEHKEFLLLELNYKLVLLSLKKETRTPFIIWVTEIEIIDTKLPSKKKLWQRIKEIKKNKKRKKDKKWQLQNNLQD